ncbi:hypothetical protein [Rhizobium sp. RU36D]|uniref:hypothetical protein n=1 Tax=Rhizobium sp. RU36D TaxID=1907415 RepID=UPI0009D8C2D9|nr:hypothetical protein [Rhizobium sp. RU36D]SMC76002.1 hypothetical protein SAMN05880593_10632 [Rhizobium sp. RU36D]
MRAIFWKFCLVGLTGLILSGCCSNVTTDPREGGLAGGVCGTTTGAYDRRLAALGARAGSLQSANAGLQARLASTNREATSLAQEITAKRRQLAAVQSELDKLQRLASEKETLRAEITGLKAEARAREARIMQIEKGMRSAANDRIREDARRQAEGVPVDDLLKRIRDIRAEAQ